MLVRCGVRIVSSSSTSRFSQHKIISSTNAEIDPTCQSTHPCTSTSSELPTRHVRSTEYEYAMSMSKVKNCSSRKHLGEYPSPTSNSSLVSRTARHVRPVVPYHIVSIPYLEIFDAQTFISECKPSYVTSASSLGAKSTNPASSIRYVRRHSSATFSVQPRAKLFVQPQIIHAR